MTASVEVTELYQTDALPPMVPSRLRKPLFSVVDNFMPPAFEGKVGSWLHANRRSFGRSEAQDQVGQFCWELPFIDELEPQLFAELRGKIIEASKTALDVCAVADFDLTGCEMHASVYHHAGSYTWHDDQPEGRNDRRLGFAYYLRSDPPMFKGGELEFLDGTTVEPISNRLVFLHPIQKHRVRPVECWSADFLHGRWAIFGWLTGPAPDGWDDLVARLRQGE